MNKGSITKPPKLVLNFFSKFRKWKLGRYKKKKVRQEKTRGNRVYWIKFKVKILDDINPQEFDKEFEMMVPAKAAFFAKQRAKAALLEKIDLYFIDCERVTDKEMDAYDRSMERYINKKKRESR